MIYWFLNESWIVGSFLFKSAIGGFKSCYVHDLVLDPRLVDNVGDNQGFSWTHCLNCNI